MSHTTAILVIFCIAILVDFIIHRLTDNEGKIFISRILNFGWSLILMIMILFIK